MAIAQVFAWHPRPGRLADFITVAQRADKIIRSLGGSTRTLNAAVGAIPGGVLYVIESTDWNTFATLQSKMASDKAWQALLAEVNSTKEPTSDLVSSALYAEVLLG
jgi:hypothetical protein